MTIAEYISQSLNDAVVGIKNNLTTKNINATGKTSESIRVVELDADKHWQIVGGGQNCAPIATLEVGRKGGKVPMGFTEIIYNWGIAKGMSDWSMESAAKVAWKIKRKGTNRHEINEDVYSTIITTTKENISKEAVKFAAFEVKQVLGKVIHDFST